MSSTRYLNRALMDSIDVQEFWQRRPFPWLNPREFVLPDRHRELLETLPDVALFYPTFYGTRKHGQGSHDRYVLDYQEGMALSEPWRDFIEELRGDVYRQFVCKLLRVGDVRFRFHWHYTPNGGEVSPHCDSRGKLGSHIFYLNTEQDWDPAWGGQTVVLDDGGKFPANSAPAFDDFLAEYAAEAGDNRSFLFARRGNSWHGVHRIQCPENRHRKVFIVVFETRRLLRMALKRVKRGLQGKPLVTEKEGMMY